MKIKRLSKGKTIAALSFAMVPSIASAGKVEPQEGDPPRQLTLQQVAIPFEAIIQPFNDGDFDFIPDGEEEGFFEDELEDYGDIGIIFGETNRIGEESGNPVLINFVVSHIRNDMPVDVYLAYSTGVAPFAEGDEHPGLEKQGNPLRNPPPEGALPPPPDGEGEPPPPEGAPLLDGPRANGDAPRLPGQHEFDEHKPRPPEGAPPVPPVKAGKICVNFNGLKLIAAAHVEPIKQFLDARTPLGKVRRNPHSVTFSVNLGNLQAFVDRDQTDIFFQAAVFPRGGLERNEFGEAQVSECDHFFIEYDDPETDFPEGSKIDHDDGEFQEYFEESENGSPDDGGGK